MAWITVAAFTLIGTVAFAAWWRAAFLRERPIAIWDRELAGPAAAIALAAEATGLTAERLPPGWDWLVDLSLAPVWFFWGDLRTRRPARQLRRWRLAGTRAGRGARVRFDGEVTFLELDAQPRAPLWAEPAARRPFADQEGLRPLLPVGSTQWGAGTAQLEAAFAAGAQRIATSTGALVAEVDGAVPPARWAPIFDALAALARALEG
jgi:hypothetical protein